MLNQDARQDGIWYEPSVLGSAYIAFVEKQVKDQEVNYQAEPIANIRID